MFSVLQKSFAAATLAVLRDSSPEIVASAAAAAYLRALSP